MKFFSAILFICFSCLQVFPQREANSWVFGKAGGIQFNQGAPLTSGSNIFSEEGCSSISDKNGNLIIYCEGEVIFNRNRVAMKNGTGIAGSKFSTQASVIIPMRGSDNWYAVFNVASTLQDLGGLWYSIVDMDGDDGNGEVVVKNIPLISDVYEKITAVRHCNKIDTWVTVHKFNSDKYYSFLVSPGGISTTGVESSTGFVTPNNLLASVGAMKFSPKGDRLAAVFSYTSDMVQLLDFNNQTGVLSNSRVFKANTFTGILEYAGSYGVEFSPDGNLFYVSAQNTNTRPGDIFQFDANATTVALLLASRQLVGQSTSNTSGNMQLAPDGKIYIAYFGTDSLGVIHNPNVAGLGCGFQRKYVGVGFGPGAISQLGLPSFDQSFFDPNTISYSISRDSSDCSNPAVQFRINQTTGFDSLRWYFGDGNQSTVFEPLHVYGGTGLYIASLVIYRPSCAGNSESYDLKIWIAPPVDMLGPNKLSCPPFKPQVLSFGAPDGSQYLWSNGATQSSLQVNSPGTYWLRVKYSGCAVTDTVRIDTLELPDVKIAGAVDICNGTPVSLTAVSSQQGVNYLWSNGSTGPINTVSKIGRYTVIADLNGCKAFDTVTIAVGDCPAYIPSAFSPNGDSRNDEFGVLTEFANTQYSLTVFNRYGQVVFNGSSPIQKWDGNFKNQPLPGGAYPWILRYKNKKGELQFYRGTVVLIR